MWFFTEIANEIGETEVYNVLKKCKEEGVKINPYFSDKGEFLGDGITDEDCKRLFGLGQDDIEPNTQST